MWGLLGLALLVAVNPVLIGIILLMISRPRPIQNLLVFWVGSMTVNLLIMLIPLIVLHSTPAFAGFAQDMATRTTVQGAIISYIQIGVGVLGLSVAALMTIRLLAHRPVNVPKRGGDTSVLVLDSDTPTATSGSPSQDDGAEYYSIIRRLGGRARTAWSSGSLWVAFSMGMCWTAGPYVVLLVDTTIVASGAGIATQLIAAIAFVIAMLAVVEITLLCHLVAPSKTEAVLRPLHDWARAHPRQILIAMFTIVGFWLVAKGTGTI